MSVELRYFVIRLDKADTVVCPGRSITEYMTKQPASEPVPANSYELTEEEYMARGGV